MKTEKKNLYSTARKGVEIILLPIDRFFNFLFTSEYNPIYRSGTISAYLMMTVVLTGFYLVFFYKLNAPYESVANINSQIWTGQWIRSVHRYASDAAVLSVFFHILRMVAQGKTWGPRLLAWLSGVLLMFLLFVSGWTGYVLVWDAHGHALAEAGAKILDSAKIFGDPISRAFNGETLAPPSSFFFMNLFLHIVIPLSMIFGLWVHTAKMARAVWFPHKKLMIALTSVVATGGILLKAPLLNKANPLMLYEKLKVDTYFDFWIKWGNEHPGLLFLAFSLSTLMLLTIPFWLKPKAEDKPTLASNDPNKCQGCSQCVKDCPYEAIQMVPRTIGKGSPIVALANPDLCVGCGLCAASCDPFTMGPEGRRARDLFKIAKEVVAKKVELDPSQKNLVIACQNQKYSLERIKKSFANKNNFQIFPVECSGTVHAAVIEYFARNYKHVLVTACPGRNCTNKDGYTLLSERIIGTRLPTFSDKFDASKVALLAVGDGEEQKILHHFKISDRKLSLDEPDIFKKAIAVACGLILFLGVSVISQTSISSTNAEGILRLSWRLAGQNIKTCHKRTAEELASLPAHMRTPEVCDQKSIDYNLKVFVNEKEKINRMVKAGGVHGDRPLYVNEDLELAEGVHTLQIQFEPNILSEQSKSLNLNTEITVTKNEIVLVMLSPDQNGFVTKRGSANETESK